MGHETPSDFVASRVKNVSNNAQIAGEILESWPEEDGGRPDYFYLRDLTNPQQAYWEHIGEAPPTPEGLQRAFDYGNYIHAKAGRAFSRLDDVSEAEGVLDGAAVDLGGIRGRVDFRFGNSLAELKTTRRELATPDDLWEKAPQDLEQLLFYAAMWTFESDSHFLIYYFDGREPPFLVFEVEIENRGGIQHALKQRRDRLSRAIETKDPSLLYRCRYFDSSCSIAQAGLCSCEDLDELSVHGMDEMADLRRDTSLETELGDAWEEAGRISREKLSAWDLEVPRQAYGRITGERPRDDWIPSGSDLWKAFHRSDLAPGVVEKPSSRHIFEPMRLSPSGSWMKFRKTTASGTSERMVPVLLRDWEKEYDPTPKYLSNYIYQLGVTCAIQDEPIGFLVLYATDSEEVYAYEIEYGDLGDIKREAKDRVRALHDAVESNEVDALPECPDWWDRERCENCLCE